MTVILMMLLLGAILGFIGAGGAGFIIAILTLLFKVPIHVAVATSLTAMAFTTLSGALSHYREGNIAVRSGLLVGGFGAIGAFIGSQLAVFIPEQELHYFTGGMLLFSAALLVFRLFFLKQEKEAPALQSRNAYIAKTALLGIVTGLLSGAFGIGSTPFIQLGLLVFLGLNLRQSVGTTMLVIVPIAIGGGIGYMTGGLLDGKLLLQVLIGTMIGAYIGAKFTSIVPKPVLKTAMIAVPIISGLLLMF